VIFGAWDRYSDGGVAQVLDEEWQRSETGRKRPAYPEAVDYLRLVEAGTHRLVVFPMIYSKRKKTGNSDGPSAIRGFVPELTECSLTKIGTKWFATPTAVAATFAEELTTPGTYLEGAASTVLVNSYERNPKARAACVAHYGTKCVVCHFNFADLYGELGAGYSHVHHLVPLASIGVEYELDAIRDLRPVCPNCHSMLHRRRPTLSIEELQQRLQK
jgi:5-methylcytosine-specific restriction enzyme A